MKPILKKHLLLLVPILGGAIILIVLLQRQAYQSGLKQGRQEIENKYQEKMAKVFPSRIEPTEIYSFDGEIINIQDKNIVLRQKIFSPNPLEEPEIKDWTVKVTEATGLFKRVAKTAEEMAEEEGTISQPLTPTKEVAINFSELANGQTITVSAAENLKGKTEFEAQKIVVSLFLTP